MPKQIESLEGMINQIEDHLGRKPQSMSRPPQPKVVYADYPIDNSNEPLNIDVPVAPKPFASSTEKTIFTLPESTKPASPEVARFRPGMGAARGDKVVGAVAPDFSGYEDMINNLPKRHDTSTADLISMGVSTGLGAMFGRVGAGAKAAGEYGLKRAEHAEKRQESLEDMIAKLRFARAQQMAKGVKGTKLKGGSDGSLGAKDLYKMKYVDGKGIERNYRYMNEFGEPIADDSDPVANMPTVAFRDQDLPDGTTIQHAQAGNQVRMIGSKNPQLKTEKNANGETYLLNDRSGGVRTMGPDINKTSAELSPYATPVYKSIVDKSHQDPLLKGLEGSYNDMSLGLASIQRGDIAGALAATKMAASSLEKGRMTSDKDLAQVSAINLGIAQRMEMMLDSAIEGGKLTEPNRRELESLFSLIEANTRDAHSRRIGRYAVQAKSALGKEWRDDLSANFGSLPKFTGKKQSQLVNTALNTQRDVLYTGEFTEVVKDPSGAPVLENGKPVKYVFILTKNKEGKTVKRPVRRATP